MKFLYLIITLMILSTSVNAMGDREKGALLGAGGVIILHQLFNNSNQNNHNYKHYENYDRYDRGYRDYEYRRVPVCREYRYLEYDRYGRPFEVIQKDCR